MTLLARAFSNAGLESRGTPFTSDSVVEYFGGDHSTQAGVSVSEAKAVTLPAVWRAVSLIASGAASLPLHAYRDLASGGRERVPSDTVAGRLTVKPHPDMTSFELWEIVFTHLLLWGNAYLWVGRDSLDRPKELWPLNPAKVKAKRDGVMKPKYYMVGQERYSDREILHIPGLGYDGICGLSPISAARESLGLAKAAESYGAKLFGSGALATGVLTSDRDITQKQSDVVQERWKARQTGLNSAHGTVVLGSGLRFDRMSIPPDDAQFLQTRSFQVTEVARIFGVPSHMLFDTERSTSWGSGIEQQGLAFVTYTLRPWLTRVERRLSQLFFQEAVYARFSVDGLLRGDSAQRAQFYTAMSTIGALSINEIRALEERSAVEGGDEHYRQLNLSPITQDQESVDA